MFAMVRRSSLWENLPFTVTSRGVTVPVAAQIVSASCARCEYGRALYSTEHYLPHARLLRYSNPDSGPPPRARTSDEANDVNLAPSGPSPGFPFQSVDQRLLGGRGDTPVVASSRTKQLPG
jgi:hypothetical protein